MRSLHTFGLILLAGPILATLFYSEAFNAEDVRMASRSLMAYALGLVGFMSIKVLAPGYYARQDTRTPVRFAVIAMVVNMVFNILLMFPLGHVGLALATTISASVNAFLLWRGLRREGAYQPESGWPKLGLQAAAACVAMAAVLVWGVGSVDVWLERTGWERVGQLLLWIAIGGVVYFGALFALGFRVREFRGKH